MVCDRVWVTVTDKRFQPEEVLQGDPLSLVTANRLPDVLPTLLSCAGHKLVR